MFRPYKSTATDHEYLLWHRTEPLALGTHAHGFRALAPVSIGACIWVRHGAHEHDLARSGNDENYASRDDKHAKQRQNPGAKRHPLVPFAATRLHLSQRDVALRLRESGST